MMSIVATGARPTRKAFSTTKRTSVVVAVALLALIAFAALIPASEAENAKHYYSAARSTPDRPGAGAPVSEPGAVPRMSKKEALDAYAKLPLSFIPNEGQTDKAVRYYAQDAGYGFFFSHKGAILSFANGKGRGGQALALERVMNLGENRIGMRIPRSTSFPRDLRFPHS